MSDILALDSGPLGLLTQPQRTPEVLAVSNWLKECLRAGARILTPAIVFYEIRRELLRADKTSGLRRLDAFVNGMPGRYVVLTDDALRLAAELWAKTRRDGRPTAESTALDIDVILAAQILTLGERDVVVATTNPKHLSRFLPARLWTEIDPASFSSV